MNSLPAGPMAIKGIACHKVIEKLLGYGRVEGKLVLGELKNFIDLGLQRCDNGLLKEIYRSHGVAGCFSTDQLIRACQFVRKQIDLIPQHRFSSKEDATGHNNRVSISSLGSEKWFESARLDLAGAIDLTYISNDGVIHVVDFKTGGVLDDTNAVKNEYELQIGAYGMLVSESFSKDSILLELIGTTSTWEGTLDFSLVHKVKNILVQLTTVMPKNIALDSTLLANTGEHCHTCAYRPSCGRYIENFKLGSDGKAITSPHDIDGLLVAIEERNDFFAIKIRTSQKITVSISGVSKLLYPKLQVGDAITAYSLGSFEAKGRAISPANFYMCRVDNPRLSAFESMLIIN
jgi:hypothetical protein